MRHSNWFASRKQQQHQRTIDPSKVDLSTVDIHAKINCKACHGRGYSGRNLTTGETIPCKCLTLKAKVEHHEVVPTENGHSS